MNDLLEAVNVKNEELTTIMNKKYKVDIDNIDVNDKINSLMEREHMVNPKKLIKQSEKS